MSERSRLEVCVDSIDGLYAAVSGGADRIELCAALSLDGLTPSMGLMRLAAQIDRPIYAMVRPRGGDFVYDQAEVEVMLRDIDAARAAGLAGVVLGASLASGRLDTAVLRRLARQAHGLGMTLHRAIDIAPDRLDALDIAVELGFERVLTSGGAATAEAGAAQIAEMVEHAGDRLTVMAGAGVTAANAAALIARTRVTEVHSSCSSQAASGITLPGTPPDRRRRTRPEIVRALIATLDQIASGASSSHGSAGPIAATTTPR